MLARELHQGWTLHSAATAADPGPRDLPVVSAQVPGCVHTDLLAAELIPDPYLDDNETVLDWVGRRTWNYRSTFQWQPDENRRHDLVFDGLDTVATIVLNGREIGRTANQHRTYRFDVAEVLVPGDNNLEISFASAWVVAEAERERLGDRPNAYPTPFQFIRKMACNFGWDWGPQVVTAGIWRPVRLESWSVARLAVVRPTAGFAADETGQVEVQVELELEQPELAAELALQLSVGGSPIRTPDTPVKAEQLPDRVATAGVSGRTAVVTAQVPTVQRWWPAGRGDQPLYQLQLELRRGDDLLDSTAKRIGFRTVELDTSIDEIGSAFTFVVNGEPLFIRGSNWIPDDAFPSRITRQRLADRIGQAVKANHNLLRVWGGGIYESDDFYDLCDERGLLVWQDFLFACAAYPEEEPHRSEVAAEARDNIVRLLPHPSLVLWNGGNETLWGHVDWDWQEPLAGRTWGAGYYHDLLPRLVAELDPTRPYYPGSPFSGHRDVHPNADHHGLRHIWDVWNDVDYTVYGDYRPRFASEFGYQAPPTATTLRRSIHDDPLTPNSPGMQVHQKAIDGNHKLARGAAAHLPVVTDIDDWLILMHIQQAQAVRFGIEHFRSLRGECMGSIVWQLNDCWPVTSWAAIDGDGRPKLLYTALTEAYAPQLLTIQPRAGQPTPVLINDQREEWSGTLTARRTTFDGTVLAQHQLPVTVPGDDKLEITLPRELTTPGRPASEVLLVDMSNTYGTYWPTKYYFVPDKDLELPETEIEVTWKPSQNCSVAYGDQIVVTVTSPVLARHVSVAVDRLVPDAITPPYLFDLLPNTPVSFPIRRRSGGDRSDPVRWPEDAGDRRILTHLQEITARAQ